MPLIDLDVARPGAALAVPVDRDAAAAGRIQVADQVEAVTVDGIGVASVVAGVSGSREPGGRTTGSAGQVQSWPARLVPPAGRPVRDPWPPGCDSLPAAAALVIATTPTPAAISLFPVAQNI